MACRCLPHSLPSLPLPLLSTIYSPLLYCLCVCSLLSVVYLLSSSLRSLLSALYHLLCICFLLFCHFSVCSLFPLFSPSPLSLYSLYSLSPLCSRLLLFSHHIRCYRNQLELETLVGYLINPVALRASVNGNLPFLSLMHQLQQTVIQAIIHQEYPFHLLVNKLNLPRDPSRSPIFQTFFVLEKGYSSSESTVSSLMQVYTLADCASLLYRTAIISVRLILCDSHCSHCVPLVVWPSHTMRSNTVPLSCYTFSHTMPLSPFTLCLSYFVYLSHCASHSGCCRHRQEK